MARGVDLFELTAGVLAAFTVVVALDAVLVSVVVQRGVSLVMKPVAAIDREAGKIKKIARTAININNTLLGISYSFIS